MPVIPAGCLGLWKQVKSGPVDVHEQELSKAMDIRQLFELGLIRIVESESSLLPARALVLSEKGKELAQAELNN